VSELANSMMKVVEDVAESLINKSLKAQPVHRVYEAKPGEQED
jgi:hypothetical protein